MPTHESSKKPANNNREKENYSSGSSAGRSNSSNLHEAAEKMRSPNPEERSEGASEMGRSGGKQSHKND